MFRAAGVEAEAIPTAGPGTAAEQALQLAAGGCEAIIACGGDGTVHEAMQQIVAQRTPVALGTLPLGTGNGLAAELGIPRAPRRGAEALLRFQPRRIPVGRVESTLVASTAAPVWTRATSPARPNAKSLNDPTGESPASTQSSSAVARYFIIAAGAGADAEIIYRLSLGMKRRLGVTAYYIAGLQLFCAHRFVPFELELRALDGSVRRDVAGQLAIARIANFGGAMRTLVPRGALTGAELRLVYFRTPRRWPLLRHAVAASVDRFWNIPTMEIASATEVTCRPLAADVALEAPWRGLDAARRVYTQADGELLGGLPARFSLVPDALTLLMP